MPPQWYLGALQSGDCITIVPQYRVWFFKMLTKRQRLQLTSTDFSIKMPWFLAVSCDPSEGALKAHWRRIEGIEHETWQWWQWWQWQVHELRRLQAGHCARRNDAKRPVRWRQDRQQVLTSDRWRVRAGHSKVDEDESVADRNSLKAQWPPLSAHPTHPTHPGTLNHKMSTMCSKFCSKLCSGEMTTEVKLIRLNRLKRLNSFNYVISRRRTRRASFHATISLPVKEWGDDQLHHLSDALNVTLKA